MYGCIPLHAQNHCRHCDCTSLIASTLTLARMICSNNHQFLTHSSQHQWAGPHLGMWQQTLDVLRHAGGVVGCGAAYALHHVHAVARLLADSTVVLGAPEVGPLLGHLGQLQGLCTPAPPSGCAHCFEG